MVRTKLILICQCSGEFVVKDDGSMLYTGGDAHAVDINHETQFDDLKLKLAEMLNLDYKSLVIKYFLPGNNRTLITLSNDKDLKRMYEFHGNSVTADVFVMGKAGFDAEALSTPRRASGIKLDESVTPIPADTSSAANPVVIVSPRPLSRPAGSVMSIEERAQSSSGAAHTSSMSPAFTATDGVDATSSNPTNSVSVNANASVQSMDEIDLSSTPADTVKKRRRTAAWKIGANGPTIVSVTDNGGDKRRVISRKKNILNHSTASETDDGDQRQGIHHRKDSSTSNDHIQDIMTESNDLPPEKLVTFWKNSITGAGQEFKSVKEFRDALQKYAIAHRFMYRLKKNDTNRASGRCIAEGCSWKIHASLDSSTQKFKIKNMNEVHTCGREFWKSYHPTKSWLVSIIKDRLQDSPHLKPKELANSILQDFGIAVNYTQVWRGIEDARELLMGSYKEAYKQLPKFCEKLAEANPGSNIMLFKGEDNRFQRVFMCFQASVHGFQNGCRPILFLDVTSLKSKYHETLLSASAVDGDDGVFPVAFAIVDHENDGNWHWFLKQLRSVLSTSESITFVTDREKGLKKTVGEVFENAHHGYSLHHLLESFKGNLKGPFYGDGKGSLPIYFMAAARAIRLDGFKRSVDQIRRVSSQAYDWVQQIEPECWTNAVFKGERYNHLTSDVAETYINWIEEVREYPILRKVEVLSSKLMELVSARRTDSSMWQTKLTPSKEEKLQQQTHQAYGLKVLFSSDTLFEVHKDSINVVDITKWECSCLHWKATGLPCCHAIAVFNCTGRSVYDYCSRFYKVENFRLTYSECINPPAPFKPLDSDAIDHVLPPSVSKPQNEEKKKEPKTKRASTRTVSCTKCREEGHNKATCKATSTPTIDPP